MFKLFRNLKSLQIIFNTFIQTLPSLVNIGGLMFLLIYIYSVIAVNIFADVKMKSPMHWMLNFQTVPTAFLTLIRVATGENWNDLLDAVGMGYTITNQCIENATYNDYVDNGYQTVGCGNFVVANIYFGSYILLIPMIFLNLFIAIILNGYFEVTEREKQIFNTTLMEKYRDSWSRFDPDATGFIHNEDFNEFMFELGAPLGWDEKY